jgi:hypothetical protein
MSDMKTLRWILMAVFAATPIPPLRAGEANQVWPLPALDDAAAWTATPKGEKPFTFDCRSESGALFVRLDCAKDNAAELRLKEPVPMPEGVTGFTFLCGNNGTPSSLWIKVLARDALGKEFAFHTYSRFSFDKGWFSPEHFTRRVCEERFTTPGFGRPKPEPAAGATLEGPAPNIAPQPPYTLLGLRFSGSHQRGAFTEFFFRGFAMTRLDPRAAPFYYQFRDVESFGELEPLPYLTPGHMGKWGGRRFELSWELRDRYDATPFLVDGKRFEFAQAGWQEKSDGVPYPLQLAQRIEFPIKEKGTYWARVRLRWWYDGKSPIPQEVSEREFRLDVVNGAGPVKRAAVPAEAMAPNCFIRIAPDRKSLIFGNGEKFAVKVAFRNPGEAVKDATFRVVVRRAAGDEDVKALELTPAWEGEKPFTAAVDLGDLKPGVYKLLAEIRSGQQLFDQVERVVARKGPPAKPAAVPIPASVPSWQELLASPKPMFHLSPAIPDNLPQGRNGAQAWDEQYRPFLDKAGELSTQIEFPLVWNTVEPLPGVFDWSVVDRFVDYAQSKGLTVQLWPSFRDLPEWMPGRFEMSADGTVFGARHMYLFHGARPNFVNAPEIRGGMTAFIRAVAERYRGHPGVQSYFFCFEHPGDAPYNGWYEGYAPESVQAFRREMKRQFGRISRANRRWGTAFASWDEVVPPPESASSRYRLDWRRFKANGIEGVLKDCVMAIRSADPRRLVMVYGDGAADWGWFGEQGCMSANGGCEKAIDMPGYAAYALAGFPQRAEEISVGNWSACFPTQLDASLFAMMAGGGANAHCKAYVWTKNRFSDLADPNVSLGRYRRFMPIWTELRPTELAQPIEAFLARDCGSVGTYGLIGLMQAQVPSARGVGDLWRNGKLLLAIDLEPWAPTEMDREQIARVVNYVETGGSLLMSADAGRKCVDEQDADWVLLRRFGLEPPVGEALLNHKATAVPEPGAIFGSDAKPFTLRETWNVKPPAGMETEAFLDGDRQRAALSWKRFGKGKVAILWAQTLIPPLFSKPEAAYPFLRDVARWAGIGPMADTTDSRLWTNLLKTKDGSTFYGLTHVGSWQGMPATAVDGAVRWLVLPEGNYQVTEIISGKEVGDFTAARLKSEGLLVKLAPREVAIFRMVRKR